MNWQILGKMRFAGWVREACQLTIFNNGTSTEFSNSILSRFPKSIASHPNTASQGLFARNDTIHSKGRWFKSSPRYQKN